MRPLIQPEGNDAAYNVKSIQIDSPSRVRLDGGPKHCQRIATALKPTASVARRRAPCGEQRSVPFQLARSVEMERAVPQGYGGLDFLP